MTLIEVLVSVLLLSFGLLGLIGLQGRAAQISAGAEDSGRAALLGNEIATALVLNATAGTFDTSATSAAAVAAAGAASALPNGAALITPSADMKEVSIAITWQAPSAAAAPTTSKYSTQVVLP